VKIRQEGRHHQGFGNIVYEALLLSIIFVVITIVLLLNFYIKFTAKNIKA